MLDKVKPSLKPEHRQALDSTDAQVVDAVGRDTGFYLASTYRCILNPSRVKPDARTPQMPPPFSHRPLHGCSCGGFLCLCA